MPEFTKKGPGSESYESPRPAQEKMPERQMENNEGIAREKTPEKIRKHPTAHKAAKRVVAIPSAPTADPELKTIENILASGMDSFFLSLSPQKQLEFKSSGEATAIRIKKVLHKKICRVKDIVRLIVAWLKTLPGINKFFLEQEAKIKADTIIHRFKR